MKGLQSEHGEMKMANLINSTKQEVGAQFICEHELADFLLLENCELFDILDNHFDIEMQISTRILFLGFV